MLWYNTTSAASLYGFPNRTYNMALKYLPENSVQTCYTTAENCEQLYIVVSVTQRITQYPSKVYGGAMQRHSVPADPSSCPS